MVTLTSAPASSRESRRFCAWAGAWEPQPMTPIFLMPSNALGMRGKRSRPPLTMVSVVSANLTSWGEKTSEVKLFHTMEEVVEQEQSVGEIHIMRGTKRKQKPKHIRRVRGRDYDGTFIYVYMYPPAKKKKMKTPMCIIRFRIAAIFLNHNSVSRGGFFFVLVYLFLSRVLTGNTHYTQRSDTFSHLFLSYCCWISRHCFHPGDFGAFSETNQVTCIFLTSFAWPMTAA